MRINLRYKKNKREKGSALLISLVVLFVMTLISAASFSNAVFTKKLIIGAKYRESAMQNAELALRETEKEILSMSSILHSIFLFGGEYSNSMTGLYQNIEFMNHLPIYRASNGLTRRYIEKIGSRGNLFVGDQVTLYRITVLAAEEGYDINHENSGIRPRAQAMLQSIVALNASYFGPTALPANFVRGRISWRELRLRY